MATTAFAGFSGQLFLSTAAAATSAPATTPFAELMDVTLSVTAAELDAFSKDSSGWDEVIYGKRSWTATGKAIYHDSTGSTGQAIAFDAITGGTKMGATFRATSSSGILQYSGGAIVTKWDISFPDAGVTALDVALKGTGSLVRAASTS